MQKFALSRGFLFTLQLVIVFVVYVLSAKIGLSLDPISGFATLVWPSTGIALASLVLFGPRVWPAIFVAAFFVNLTAGAPPLVALGIAFGNTLEAVVGRILLKKFTNLTTFMNHSRDVFTLAFLTATISTALSATIGVISLSLGGLMKPGALFNTWSGWWIGDMLGDLIFFPLIVTWSNFSFHSPKMKRELESLVFLVVLIFADLMIFAKLFANHLLIVPRVYFLFP